MTLAPAPTPPEPAGSAVRGGRGVGTCDTGGVVRTVQVTGLFDLSPSSVPSREVHEKSTAGTSQVSKGPAGTGAAPASWEPVIGVQSLHSAGRAQARQARRAARRGSANEGHCARRHSSPPSKAIPRCQQGSRDCPWIPWAMRGPDRRTTVIFRGPSRLFAKDGQPSNSRSKRSGEPLLRLLADHPAGFMIADAVRYMSVHSWKQPDSHRHSGTSQRQKQQPARPGTPSPRAVFAGGGR
jgi:hypothetical protein